MHKKGSKIKLFIVYCLLTIASMTKRQVIIENLRIFWKFEINSLTLPYNIIIRADKIWEQEDHTIVRLQHGEANPPSKSGCIISCVIWIKRLLTSMIVPRL